MHLWADNQSHASLVYSELPAMRHVNDGVGLRVLHLSASDLGSAPDLVTALLCVTLVKSRLPMVCEMEAAFCLPV